MINFRFPRLDEDDPPPAKQVNRMFDAVDTAFAVVETLPLVEHVLVGPVAIGTGDTRVYHGLTRAPRGYWVVRASVDVRVFDGATPETADRGNFMTLRASTAATVTLLVF